jgi:hypothetical protein
MANYLPADAIVLAYAGFKATKSTLEQLLPRMVKLNINKDDKVVLDLLSNSFLMGTDEEGLSSPAFAGEYSTYHIPGSLTVASAASVKKILSNCSMVGKLCSGANMVVLVAPLPRYLTKKCCDDPDHTENFNCEDEDFESEIVAGIELHKWAHKLNMNFRLVDATA